MIKADGLTVQRGRRTVIDKINFTADAGQVTVIVGPNGSGKTTFIKALSGDVPYVGTVSFNGDNIKHRKPWQMALMRAVLPQSTTMSFPYLVREVVELGMGTGFRLKKAPDKEDVPERALERVDLAGYAGRYYQELSGGEQARVQLARVLCQIWHPTYHGKPCWLILDEPVASLDIHHQLVVMDIARDFACSGGGVLSILHDLNLAAYYGDKIVLFDRGKIKHEGEPSDVLTTDNLRQVYQCKLTVGALPQEGVPFILPQSAALR